MLLCYQNRIQVKPRSVENDSKTLVMHISNAIIVSFLETLRITEMLSKGNGDMATLTVRDVSDKALDKYKDFSGHKTAVKALLACADLSLDQAQVIKDQAAEIERLKHKVNQRNQVLGSLVSLSAQVAELAGQKEFEL